MKNIYHLIKLFFLLIFCQLVSSCSSYVVQDRNEEGAISIALDFNSARILSNVTGSPSLNINEALLNSKGIINSMSTRSSDINVILKSEWADSSLSGYNILPDTLAYKITTGDSCFLLASDKRVSVPVLGRFRNGLPIKKLDQLIDQVTLNKIYSDINQTELKKQLIRDSIIRQIEPSTRSTYPPYYPDGKYDITTVKETLTDWKTSYLHGPLVPVEWGQLAPYNYYVYNKNGASGVPTGCVATAMAQFLSYYKSPGVIDGISFDWDKMASYHTYKYTEELSDTILQIAKLMQTIGEDIHTNYSPDGSSARFDDTGYLWLESHGFTHPQIYKYNLTGVKGSVEDNSPVIITGTTYKEQSDHSKGKESHAWIIDGVGKKSRNIVYITTIRSKETGKIVVTKKNYGTEDEYFLHCNWGWDSTYDGWFAEGCFNPLRPEDMTRSTPIFDMNLKIYTNIHLKK